jgi:hypothetical protein
MSNNTPLLPILIHDQGSNLYLGPNRLCCHKIKAAIPLPGNTTLLIDLNQDLDSFFRKRRNKPIKRFSENQYRQLAQMPPASTGDLEKFTVNGVTHYAFSDDYLERWLIPLLPLLT